MNKEFMETTDRMIVASIKHYSNPELKNFFNEAQMKEIDTYRKLLLEFQSLVFMKRSGVNVTHCMDELVKLAPKIVDTGKKLVEFGVCKPGEHLFR